MKHYPLMLVAYIAGVVLMRMNAPEAPWTHAQLMWLNGGAAFLVVALIGYIGIFGTRSFPRAVRTSAIATAMIAVVLGYGQRTDIMIKFSNVMSRTAPIAAVAETGGSTADVQRHWDGHFRADASINGRPVEVLVDTGASLVLLTYADALMAGVDIGALEFDVPILTANGRSHVATLKIDTISIGGVTVEGVDAAVAEHGQLHASLLGMSFLGAIEEAVIRKDRLILRN